MYSTLILLLLSTSISWSAELLVKAVDSTHSDPVENERGCYKRGDVVVVMPDGHEWGKEEGLPKFVVVKVPGLSVKDAKIKYLVPDGDPAYQVKRRLYRVNIEDVEKKKIAGAVNVSEFESSVVNKKTNKTVVQEKSEAIHF